MLPIPPAIRQSRSLRLTLDAEWSPPSGDAVTSDRALREKRSILEQLEAVHSMRA